MNEDFATPARINLEDAIENAIASFGVIRILTMIVDSSTPFQINQAKQWATEEFGLKEKDNDN